MPNLYIIAGCNGAGKTTASLTILPEILDCREFVNADNIAAGISPFNVEAVAIEAGRIMLQRIDELLAHGADFAIETTLATRSYVALVHKAKGLGYKVSLIYIWLNSPDMALERVAERVKNGGHNIPVDVIQRRYYAGISNLFKLFIPICDFWTIADNSAGMLIPIGHKQEFENVIENNDLWSTINKQVYER
jgi:predicted ABC-type ATPase